VTFQSKFSLQLQYYSTPIVFLISTKKNAIDKIILLHIHEMSFKYTKPTRLNKIFGNFGKLNFQLLIVSFGLNT
jgi:hypothetical protein